MMGSSVPSARSVVDKPASMVPRTMAECMALQHWVAHGRDEPPVMVTREQLARHLEFMASALPSKAVDSETGKDRVAVYFRMLSGYTNRAIAYMAERACRERKWLPTPSECIAILASYRAPPPDREVARGAIQKFLQAEMEGFHDRLRRGLVDQGEIDAQPDQWRRIAENKGLLRRLDNGTYVQRRKSLPEQRDIFEVGGRAA